MGLAIDEALPQADIAAIKRMIPHRYPFLLIDRVVNIEVGRYAVGIKNVTVNEPHFEGHFPVLPVMPGVLIIEAMAQTSAVLVVQTLDLVDKNLLVYFMSIDTAKFRHVVTPGDTLELHVTVIRGRGKIWKFRGEARVGHTICAEAAFAANRLSRRRVRVDGRQCDPRSSALHGVAGTGAQLQERRAHDPGYAGKGRAAPGLALRCARVS